LTCPDSRTVSLRDGNSFISINFTNPVDNYVATATDIGGVASIRYSQETIVITQQDLHQTLGPFTVTAQDLQGNPSTCNFHIAVVG